MNYLMIQTNYTERWLPIEAAIWKWNWPLLVSKPLINRKGDRYIQCRDILILPSIKLTTPPIRLLPITTGRSALSVTCPVVLSKTA